jgi:ATP synthase protein I
MVAFFFLGAAAGMMNVYRVANGMGLAAGYRRERKKDDE